MTNLKNTIQAFVEILDRSYNQICLTSKDCDCQEPIFRIECKHSGFETKFYIFFNKDSGRVNRLILSTHDTLTTEEEIVVIENIAHYLTEHGQKVQL